MAVKERESVCEREKEREKEREQRHCLKRRHITIEQRVCEREITQRLTQTESIYNKRERERDHQRQKRQIEG